MDRAITAKESGIVRWLLEHAAMRDVTVYRQAAVEELRVVGGCTCGCCSLHFQSAGAGETMLADAVALYEDGQRAGLILWGFGGQIGFLEVYDFHPGASRRVPEIANLRSWEDLGKADAES
jgi:hypothetical protein